MCEPAYIQVNAACRQLVNQAWAEIQLAKATVCKEQGRQSCCIPVHIGKLAYLSALRVCGSVINASEYSSNLETLLLNTTGAGYMSRADAVSKGHLTSVH